MWSVRMRASRGGTHISGAEGLYEEAEVRRAAREYLKRALEHPRGAPDEIYLGVERLRRKPREIPSLAVSTIKCSSPAEAGRISSRLLRASGVSAQAIRAAFDVVRGRKVMRGAALVSATDGRRLEPDSERGVRASRLGIGKRARASLGRKLSRRGINTSTVREALVLASKALSCKGVIAELCVSDDPHYTTGYVATKRLGYVRIPNIKRKGSTRGGRVYFVEEGADLEGMAGYLEKTPVLLVRSGQVKGECSADELLRGTHS